MRKAKECYRRSEELRMWKNEYEDILTASELAKHVQHPNRNIVKGRPVGSL